MSQRRAGRGRMCGGSPELCPVVSRSPTWHLWPWVLPQPLSPPPAPVTYWLCPKHTKLRSCLLAFALAVLLLGTPSPRSTSRPLGML